MSFVKFSSEYVSNNYTQIDNIFLNNYLPYAPSEFVKVYVYAVYISSIGDCTDNTLESFCKILKMDELEIMNAFKYWENQGLLKMYGEPVSIALIPTRDAIRVDRKWSENKYDEFNLMLQDIKGNKMIFPYEYNQYYDMMERIGINIPAMLELIQFCANQVGSRVSPNYVKAVAEDWAINGTLTSEYIQSSINGYLEETGVLKDIVRALKSKRKPTFEDHVFYEKWTKDYGFTHAVIVYVAKQINYNPSIYRLDSQLSEYFELKTTTMQEIESYEKNKESMAALAKDVVKALGLRYQDYGNIVSTYINPWLRQGYNAKTLISIANICFKQNIKTLEGMNLKISEFYDSGIVSTASLNQHLEKATLADDKIKEILKLCGLEKQITTWDRDYYRTWTYSWDMPEDVIKYGATLSKDKDHPLQYLNRMLSSWHELKLNTIEKVKAYIDANLGQTGSSKTQSSNKRTTKISTRTYTKEELSSVFTNIDDFR